MGPVLAAEQPDDHVEHLRRDAAQQRSRMERLLEILRLECLLEP